MRKQITGDNGLQNSTFPVPAFLSALVPLFTCPFPTFVSRGGIFWQFQFQFLDPTFLSTSSCPFPTFVLKNNVFWDKLVWIHVTFPAPVLIEWTLSENSSSRFFEEAGESEETATKNKNRRIACSTMVELWWQTWTELIEYQYCKVSSLVNYMQSRMTAI